jgi:hypothetical protein
VLAARVLAEFGDDDPQRYVSGKARKAYAGTAPPRQARWDRRARWLHAPIAAEGGTTQPSSSAGCLDRA